VQARILYKDYLPIKLSSAVLDETFNSQGLRRLYLETIPLSIRVRIYLVRAVGVTGSRAGKACPYVWFRFGENLVRYRGEAQKETLGWLVHGHVIIIE
jgi:hypothetical protein